MSLQKLLLLLFALVFSLATNSNELSAQTSASARVYQQMTQSERSEFVASQTRRIANELSGKDHKFTPAFIDDVEQAVNHYTQRIGTDAGRSLGESDMRSLFERANIQAPTIISAFKARDVSPLIGLYLPWVESEYVNIQSPNSMGAIGMYQFLPQTGERLGLSPGDLLDVQKSADAAARYITDSLKQFDGDPMLALLAYNRGDYQTARDLKRVVNDANRQCSICALSADRAKLDDSFRSESVYYVPRFFAAAIIGENPQAFGLQTKPLSSN